jgi:hypothetical protein
MDSVVLSLSNTITVEVHDVVRDQADIARQACLVPWEPGGSNAPPRRIVPPILLGGSLHGTVLPLDEGHVRLSS